jgi:hypothetical protein
MTKGVAVLHPTWVDDLSSIPDGWGKSPEWVTWCHDSTEPSPTDDDSAV